MVLRLDSRTHLSPGPSSPGAALLFCLGTDQGQLFHARTTRTSSMMFPSLGAGAQWQRQLWPLRYQHTIQTRDTYMAFGGNMNHGYWWIPLPLQNMTQTWSLAAVHATLGSKAGYSHQPFLHYFRVSSYTSLHWAHNILLLFLSYFSITFLLTLGVLGFWVYFVPHLFWYFNLEMLEAIRSIGNTDNYDLLLLASIFGLFVHGDCRSLKISHNLLMQQNHNGINWYTFFHFSDSYWWNISFHGSPAKLRSLSFSYRRSIHGNFCSTIALVQRK